MNNPVTARSIIRQQVFLEVVRYFNHLAREIKNYEDFHAANHMRVSAEVMAAKEMTYLSIDLFTSWANREYSVVVSGDNNGQYNSNR